MEFDIGSGSLSGPLGQLVTSGNHATGSQIYANRDVERDLSASLGASGSTAYFSFLMRPQEAIEGLFGWFGFVLRGSSGDIVVGRSSFDSSYGVEVVSGGRAQTATPMVVDESRFVVMRADFAAGADTFSLFIDPLLGGVDPLTPDAVLTSADAGMITRVGLSGPGAFGFDELRIGETFADVTPSSVVPEPSTYALAAIGLLGLLACRRFRRTR